MRRYLPVLALMLAAALWGTTTSGIKYALGGFDPITLLAVELVAATAALWTVLLVRGYRPPPSWRLVVGLGLLEPALANLADTVGISLTSAANASVIYGLESVFVVVLARIFLGELISRRIVVAVIAAMLGLFALESGGSFTGPGLGDLLVMVGILSTAAYTIVAKAIPDVADALTVTAHQFAIGTLAILPMTGTMWLTGRERVPTSVAPVFWLAAIAVGLLGLAASFLLYNYAIVSVRAGTAGVIVNLTPAFGLLTAVLVLEETLTAERAFGALLIGVSVITLTRAEAAAPAGPGTAEPSLIVTEPAIAAEAPQTLGGAEALIAAQRQTPSGSLGWPD